MPFASICVFYHSNLWAIQQYDIFFWGQSLYGSARFPHLDLHLLRRLGKKVFVHDVLSPEDFIERQHLARHFWEDLLSFSVFFANFHKHFGLEQ